MKLYERRDEYKKEVHCRVCGKKGHLWVSCKVPAKMVELEEAGKEPDISLFADYYHATYSQRDADGRLVYHGQIMRSMRKHLSSQLMRKEKLQRRRALKERSLGKKKKTTSCGFCRGTGHNRRNCEVMKDFISDLSRANQNYRKYFYKKVVEDMGIAEGALVELKAQHVLVGGHWVENWTGIGLITKVDWDAVNLGLTQKRWDWKTNFEIEVQVGGDVIKVDSPFKQFIRNEYDKKGLLWRLFGGTDSGWSPHISEIISPSENLPSEEWFNHGYNECWEWLAKKYKLNELNRFLTPVIEEWHPARRGRNAPALKKRLEKYGGRHG